MKIRLLLLTLAVALIAGCNKDDGIPDGEATLKYDGDNNSGPVLEAGYHELAVFFPSATMSAYRDWKLTEVTWFGAGVDPNISSDSCAVKIYAAGNSSNEPGALLYEVDVTGSLIASTDGQWREHLLPTPLTVSGDGIWVSLAIRQDAQRTFIGCDAGPNETNGDWLFQDADNEWKPYSQRTPESVNWNIRAKVEE